MPRNKYGMSRVGYGIPEDYQNSPWYKVDRRTGIEYYAPPGMRPQRITPTPHKYGYQATAPFLDSLFSNLSGRGSSQANPMGLANPADAVNPADATNFAQPSGGGGSREYMKRYASPDREDAMGVPYGEKIPLGPLSFVDRMPESSRETVPSGDTMVYRRLRDSKGNPLPMHTPVPYLDGSGPLLSTHIAALPSSDVGIHLLSDRGLPSVSPPNPFRSASGPLNFWLMDADKMREDRLANERRALEAEPWSPRGRGMYGGSLFSDKIHEPSPGYSPDYKPSPGIDAEPSVEGLKKGQYGKSSGPSGRGLKGASFGGYDADGSELMDSPQKVSSRKTGEMSEDQKRKLFEMFMAMMGRKKRK